MWWWYTYPSGVSRDLAKHLVKPFGEFINKLTILSLQVSKLSDIVEVVSPLSPML